jgi:hypothetical protein
MNLPELPELEPFVAKCGHGTAWYGNRIRDQMREYGLACARAAMEAAAVIAGEMDYGMGEVAAAIRAACKPE